jgi:alkylated DNA repair protein (DNA oxidative demethylase)
MTTDLFDSVSDVLPSREEMADGAVLLRGFARPIQHDLLKALDDITAQAPFRHMATPGGHQMSVAMTNCGNCGWITDRSGYRYDGNDPVSGRPWPAMPPVFRELAGRAVAAVLPRRGPARGWRARIARPQAHQSDLPQGALAAFPRMPVCIMLTA